MLIKLIAPFSTEADYVFKKEGNRLEIRPAFYAEKGRGTVAYIEVCDDDERVVHRGVLQAHGTNGQLSIHRRGKPVISLFDKNSKAAESSPPAAS